LEDRMGSTWKGLGRSQASLAGRNPLLRLVLRFGQMVLRHGRKFQ
jgi:hypothetical protein